MAVRFCGAHAFEKAGGALFGLLSSACLDNPGNLLSDARLDLTFDSNVMRAQAEQQGALVLEVSIVGRQDQPREGSGEIRDVLLDLERSRFGHRPVN